MFLMAYERPGLGSFVEFLVLPSQERPHLIPPQHITVSRTSAGVDVITYASGTRDHPPRYKELKKRYTAPELIDYVNKTFRENGRTVLQIARDGEKYYVFKARKRKERRKKALSERAGEKPIAPVL